MAHLPATLPQVAEFAPPPSVSAGCGLPVVVTSLNPFGRLDQQLRCFAAWKALGFETLTFNVPDEMERLRDAGVAEADMLPATLPETGQALFGKPVPRVPALLARLAQRHSGRPVVLTNSDIFPAATGPGFVWQWLDSAPALALTREETLFMADYTATSVTPYRGGLDAFVLRPEALQRILQVLAGLPVAQRMCFGIPGWDFLLGAIIRHPDLGGAIHDSGLLLHVSHPTTYSDVSEFAHYLPAMQALTGIAASTAADAAHLFHCRIVADCQAGFGLRRMVKAAFFRLPLSDRPVSPGALRLARRFLALAPPLRWSLNLAVLARMIDTLRDTPQPEFSTLAAIFTPEGAPVQLPHLLAACVLCLMCREDSATTPHYPAGNLHAPALALALQKTACDPEARRIEIARLFCTELASYRIFNARLFNWLALSCGNDDERALLRHIRAHAPCAPQAVHTRSPVDAAA